ncbi:MAG: hypothetical protein ACM358_07370 [Gemmatimonadota bacterium]
MKTLYLPGLALAIALVAAPARGQQPTPAPAPAPAPAAAVPKAPAPAPSPVLAALLEGITLAPAQQHKVDSILTHFRAQTPPITPETVADSATLARFRAPSQQALDGVRAVLTREQQQVWDRNVERVRAATMRVGP